MTEKEISRCTGCGSWVYGIPLCGMCELGKKITEKQKSFQNCSHENLKISFGKTSWEVTCLHCDTIAPFDSETNPMLETNKLRELLEGVRNEQAYKNKN